MQPKVLTILQKAGVIVALLVIPFLGIRTLLLHSPLVYGDVPAASSQRQPGQSTSVWNDSAFGTNVRQGLNSFKNDLVAHVSHSGAGYFFLQQMLPLVLIPVTFYFFLRAVGIRHIWVCSLGAFFALVNPVVFGDLLNGQTFWIYIILPWVYVYAMKIFIKQQYTLRNAVLLGVMISLAMGALPPIVVPLCIVIVMFAVCSFLVCRLSFRDFLRSCLYGGIAVIVFIATSLPYLLVASDGQESYAPSSNSIIADYKHNYSRTDLLNVFRLAGNEGNGQSTLGYNDSSLSNIAGYAIFAVLVIGMLSYRGRNVLEAREGFMQRQHIIAIGIICLFVLGGLHILATDTTLGSNLFTTQWLFSTIRNPTKVFVLALPLYVLGVAYGLDRLIVHTPEVESRFVIAGFLLLTLIYGWPFLRGDMGLTYGKEGGIQAYQPLTSVQQLAKQTPEPSRALLVSANHRDELNYQEAPTGLNVMRLGGALPKTDSYIKEMNGNYNGQTPYFFTFLSDAGVNDVVLKKQDAKKVQFGLFPNSLSDEDANAYLGSSLTKRAENSQFTIYGNKYAKPLVYSPDKVANVKNQVDVYKMAPLMRAGSTVVNSPKQPAYADTYSSVTSAKAPDVIRQGFAQAFDPSLVTVQYYLTKSKTGQQLVIDKLDGLTGGVAESQTYDVPQDVTLFTMDNERFTLESRKQLAYIRSGNKRVSFYRLDKQAIPQQFEGENNQVGDASKSRSGNGDVYGKVINGDSVDGKRSFLLGSHNHLAYFSKQINVKADTDYQVVFHYKNLQGEAPSYNIAQGDDYIQFSNGTLDTTRSWSDVRTYINPEKTGQATINFYTDSSDGRASENLFDGLELYELHKVGETKASIKQSNPDEQVQNFNLKSVSQDRTVIIGSDFEDGQSWGDAKDASPSAQGKATIKSGITQEAKQGKNSLSLASRNHTAFVAKTGAGFKPNRVYKLSFWYKNVSGSLPSYAVWQSGANKPSPAGVVEASGEGWQYFETTFAAYDDASNLTLYLYSPSQGETTLNLFDDIQLVMQPPVDNFLLQDGAATAKPDQLVSDFRKLSETGYEIDLKKGNGLVVFNQSFTKNWSAKLVGADGKVRDMKDGHVLVNGFANGWLVDNGSDGAKLRLTYTPQLKFSKLLKVSLACYMLCGLFLLATFRPNLENRSTTYARKVK